MTTPVRIGLIGLGNQGRYYLQQIFQTGRLPRAEIAALCDVDPRRLDPFPALPHFTDSAALIRSGLVDAVIIATPHYSHTTIGIDALSRGLHVLVEKPISVHKNDCLRLLAAHTDRRVVFAAMFNQRTDTRYHHLKQLLDTGALGRLQRIHWTLTDWFRSERYYASGGWRATWAGEGGGVLLNQCPHNLDLWQRLFGMPARLRAFCHLGKYHTIETEDEVVAYLEYPSGATGVFHTTTGEIPGTNRLEIAGDRGKLVVEGPSVRLVQNEVATRDWTRTEPTGFGIPPARTEERQITDRGLQHEGIVQNFLDAILEGAPLIAPAAEGLPSVELANAMLLSSFTGETVELPLDGDTYEALLKHQIASSTFQKRVVEAEPAADMKKTFGT